MYQNNVSLPVKGKKICWLVVYVMLAVLFIAGVLLGLLFSASGISAVADTDVIPGTDKPVYVAYSSTSAYQNFAFLGQTNFTAAGTKLYVNNGTTSTSHVLSLESVVEKANVLHFNLYNAHTSFPVADTTVYIYLSNELLTAENITSKYSSCKFVGSYALKDYYNVGSTTINSTFSLVLRMPALDYDKTFYIGVGLATATNYCLPLNFIEYEYVAPTASVVPVPVEPTKDGYTFAGWFYDEELTVPYVSGTLLYSDEELYPKFDINIYNVKAYVQGVMVYEADVEYNTLIEGPEVEGYDFVGWYSDSTFATPHNGYIKSDVQLYAKFKLKEFDVVTYQCILNEVGIVIQSLRFEYGSVLHTSSLLVPSLPGYTFLGWVDHPGGNYVTSVTIDGLCYLYAEYCVNSYTYLAYGFNGEYITGGSVLHGAEVPEIEAPEVEGYEFVGWYANPQFTIPFTAQTVISDIKLYAKYDPLTFDYCIRGYSGIILQSGTIFYGDILEYEAPVVSGYTFVGWYTDNLYTVEWNSEVPVYNDITIYGKYEPRLYTVKIYGFDSLLTTLSLQPGATVPGENLTAPEVSGFSFGGWFSDSLFENAFIGTTQIFSDISIYAKYTGGFYDVKVYGLSGDVIDTLTINHGDVINAEDLTAPEVSGYTFIGWFAGGVAFDVATPITANVSLFAEYEINSYTVNIYRNAGTLKETLTIVYGKKIPSASLKAENITGYSFDGWYSDSNFMTSFNVNSLVSSDLNIYSKYIRNTYSYKLHGFDGSVLYSGSIDYGSTIPYSEFLAPVISGYDFDGWYKDSDFAYPYNFSQVLTGDINLYAKYTIKRCVLVVYGYKNVVVYSGAVDYGSLVPSSALVENPVTGYTFDGWYIDTSYRIRLNQNAGVFDNMAIYGKYNINRYACTVFGFNNVALLEIDIDHGGVLSAVNAPSVDGYVFAGWFSDPACNEVYDFGVPVLATTYVYAKYVTESFHYIIYGYSDVVLAEGTFVYGDTIPEFDAPSVVGYTFLGWCSDQERLHSFDFSIPVYTNKTIYANYQQSRYDYIIYGFTGAVLSSGRLTHGERIQQPVAPEITGYEFVGWYTDSEFTTEFDFGTVPTSDVTVYAKYALMPGMGIVNVANHFDSYWIYYAIGGVVVLSVSLFFLVKKLRG